MTILIHPLLDQINDFFSAVLNVYTQLPKDLNEEIKTMQAFLRSYDQKQLFLIQNFVRRLEAKAQKVQHQNKKKKSQKTEPDFSPLMNQHSQQNKQNYFNYINLHKNRNHLNTSYYQIDPITLLDQSNSTKLQKQKKAHEDAYQNVGEQVKSRYKGIFYQYPSKNNVFENSLIQRSLSVPKQHNKSASFLVSKDGYTSRQKILKAKPSSSPYLQSSNEDESVNCSMSFESKIEADFCKIQLPGQFEVRKKQDNFDRREEFEVMRKRVCEIVELMEGNKQVNNLQECMKSIQ